MDTAEEWLDHEDTVERQARIERLKWLEQKMPKVQWIPFCTGTISKCLFEEARYCFAYGQFLASIVLALSFIEQSLQVHFTAQVETTFSGLIFSNLQVRHSSIVGLIKMSMMLLIEHGR